jgi:hypothetical protein
MKCYIIPGNPYSERMFLNMVSTSQKLVETSLGKGSRMSVRIVILVGVEVMGLAFACTCLG